MFMLSFMFFLMMGLVSSVFMTNPSFLIIWLIFLTINVGFIMSMNLNSWMMYAVILLFTGGMMVLFTYAATLVSSLKVIFLNSTSVFLIFWISMVPCSLFPYYFTPLISKLSNLYLKSSVFILSFLGIYLMLVLLTIVKLITFKNGPLKSFFKNEI